MKQMLLVFIGGGTGSVLRYLISRSFILSGLFPFGTFIVNVAGSLLMGFILGLAVRQQLVSSNMSLLLATGFCGGFTTFSAFSFENQLLLKQGEFVSLGLYVLGSIVLGIIAVFGGIYLAKAFWS